MELMLNGIRQSMLDGATVADAVASLTTRTRGVAVAVNSEVVPQAGWATTALADGDRIEVLTAAQGG